MADRVIKTGTVTFTAEGRLLQELGLRLVAGPEVALVELIKNAFDADSPDCLVRLAADKTELVVEDHGQGMTLDAFEKRWMQIATSGKAREEFSPRFKRKMTGAKGIGRFAVRYLGEKLLLESTAYDEGRGEHTTLKATFDWPKLDALADLSNLKIPYELSRAPSGRPTGTTLVIQELRTATDFAKSRNLRTDVLRIVSPLGALDSGHIVRQPSGTSNDPGFRVVLPGDGATDEADLARSVLENYWARLTISLKRNRLEFTVVFSDGIRPKSVRIPVRTGIRTFTAQAARGASPRTSSSRLPRLPSRLRNS
ncbi:MAG: ATP-binding protein [Thermoguttaceae bacterium]